jgi:carotenoid cleavage dioxygenase-like enzyme
MSISGVETTIYDCDIDGEIPSDLNGAFYRVGPDPQYPLAPGNIAFDGEGHVGMFRIRNGRVDYRTRYVERQGPVTQHGQYAHHQSSGLHPRAEGRQPAIGDGPADARDGHSDLHV